MIDYLLRFATEADAIAALPAYRTAIGTWRPDITIPGVRVFSYEATGQKVWEPWWYLQVALAEEDEALEAMPQCAICANREAANAGLPYVIYSALPLDQIAKYTPSVVMLGSDYPFQASPIAIQSIVPIRNASYVTLPSGNIRITASYDSSIRFNYPLASLVGGRNYVLTFDVVSVTGSSPDAPMFDWCDGTDSMAGTVPAAPLPLAPGPHSIIVRRPIYDATYRFADFSNGEDEESGDAVILEITRPILRLTGVGVSR